MRAVSASMHLLLSSLREIKNGSSGADTAKRECILWAVGMSQTHRSTLCVKRTIEANGLFDDERPKPHLGNLATHSHKHTQEMAKAKSDADELSNELPKGVTAASAKIMDGFLMEGALHPAAVPTQKGFLRVFAAWLIEDDLPFTTGETGGIHRLFKYMQSRYLLPSHTTIRNVLARLFADMYTKVTIEIKVSPLSSESSTLIRLLACQIQNCLLDGHMDDAPDDVYVCWNDSELGG